MPTKKTEAINEIIEDSVEMNYEQMYKEESEKVATLENEKETLTKEKEDVVKQYNELAKKYERLFKLYANNLDFYLNDGGNK